MTEIARFTIPGEPQAQYRAIAGFDGYAVGDDGSVWSRRSLNGQGYGPWHRLIGFIARGYLRVNLRRNGRIEKRSVHRLVLSAFVGEQPELQVRHLNGKRTDNRLENLAWGTAADNAIDREGHGNTLRAEAHGMAKLSADQVREIRERLKRGDVKAQIARDFGIARTTLGHIDSGKNWRSVA